MRALALLLLGCAGLEPTPEPYPPPSGCAWKASAVVEPGSLLLICATDGGRLVVKDKREPLR